jgi:hypothetical protein
MTCGCLKRPAKLRVAQPFRAAPWPIAGRKACTTRGRGHLCLALLDSLRWLITIAGVMCLLDRTLAAQQQRGSPSAQPPRTPRASAPVDLTGYWVAVITEDWRFRMVTPPSGDFAGVPLNEEGRKVADAWDLAKDVSAGEQCRIFGAAGIMRMPVRLHVTWQDDTTLKMEIDNGNQVRFFRFDKSSAPPGQPDWQGTSLAEWETVQEGQAIIPSDRGGDRGSLAQLTGTLKVETSRMKPGYLRRNGVPYSATATLTEFFDRTSEPNGDSWVILTSIVEDPVYLSSPFMLTTHFKREPDGAKFNPRPCEMTPPVSGTAR